MNAAESYSGEELVLFEHATRWKRYLGRELAPYLHGDVLEIGAGRGGTTAYLLAPAVTSWCCLEPDPELRAEIDRKISDQELPAICASAGGRLDDLEDARRFDSVVYVDVLEHVEDDRGELMRAAARLREGGTLAVLAPAHPWLFSPFDAAIGHFRRYSRKSLRQLEPDGLIEQAARYLDAAGLLASAGNRLLLRSTDPSVSQVRFWDRCLVRVSEWLDPLLRHHVGKSVLVVWQKPLGA